MASIADLKAAFHQLSTSSFMGVQGVMSLGPSSGKTILISSMTHGNEPCGLAAVHFLLQPEVQKKLQGRVILVLNNVEGAQRYFAATSDDDRRDARISDANMNRIPEMFDSAAAHGYELKRLAELLPVFVLADFGIDFHSFPLVGPPMVIDVKGGDKRTETFIQHLPVAVTRASPMRI
jgi:predicted deacylase